MKINKEQLKENIEISIAPSKRIAGGQSCGLEYKPTILKSPELDIEISINHFRSNHKNKEYGLILFDIIIDDLIK